MGYLSKAYKLVRRFCLQKKGWSTYGAKFLLPELKQAYRSSTLPKKERKWAYDRGFYPWRIKQYSMTEDNYKSIISDKDYAYLYPLNNQYRIWIDDKLTMKYILAPFDEFLPEYYYHLMTDRGVMRLMNCPADCEASFDGVVSLLREKKLLAAKLAAGEKGVGFYRLEADADSFKANGKGYSEQSFIEFLKSLNDYIITEYIEIHPEMKKLNPSSVNTIRVMVINKNGNDPEIPFAFFRVGTKSSGAVDNMSQGGMVCKIDVESGRFYDGQVMKNHVYESAVIHPDTGEKMEGILPNWELVKKTLSKIAKYTPQLKWLGYDIAITKNGFKIIEINSHQGLHKPHEYPPEVTDFLFSELEKKKKRIS